MIHGLYFMLDKKALSGHFHVETTDRAAERNFISAVKAPGTMTCEFKDDFVLYKVADVDIHSGAVTPLDKPLLIIDGLQVVNEGVDSDNAAV